MKDLVARTIGLLVLLMEALIEGGLREVHNRKVIHTGVTRKMDIVVHTIHLLKMVIDIHAALHKVMVVVEVRAPMALPVVMDTIPIPLVVGVIVVLQMILIEQVQKTPYLLNHREGEDKTNKIDMPYITNSNKV